MIAQAGMDGRPRVVVAGGGFAALEAVLALRALAGDELRVTLVAPNSTLAYRPAATIEAVDDVLPRSYEIQGIVEDLAVSYHRGRVEAVAPTQKWVRLSSGVRREYDALVLAIGARARVGVAGALTFRDQRDVPMFRRMLDDVDGGMIHRLVFAIPSGCTWPLPLYELALLSATRMQERGLEIDITIVSPEPQPLAVFGPRASTLVADLLAERGVRFLGRSAASRVLRGGWLGLAFDAPIKADRVVAAPQLRGQRITGVPASWWGFVPTDMSGRVEGLADVYAAGDMTTFPIKQGGVAAQQADRVAGAIAEASGITVRPQRVASVLRACLLGGKHPLFLRTELDAVGGATSATLEHSYREGVGGLSKVLGRYLTPYLESRQPAQLAA
jgi:sulfide:quinone oxidoreductase